MHNPICNLRAANKDNIRRMLEIFDCARRYMRATGNLTQWPDTYPSAAVIAGDIEAGRSMVITDASGRPVATFCLLREPDPNYALIYDGEWPDDEPYVTLHRVASDGTVSGVTAAAVDYAVRLTRRNVRIDTHADNRPMQQAVERLGFKRCGIINLADGSPRIAYQLNVSKYMEINNIVPDWAKEINCAITVCDAECRIIYMNDLSRRTFAKHGDLIGRNLLDCHNPSSVAIIHRLLADGGTNAYTITKNGQRKMIYQSAWRRDGQIAGLVEISMVIPEEMPHYNRD